MGELGEMCVSQGGETAVLSYVRNKCVPILHIVVIEKRVYKFCTPSVPILYIFVNIDASRSPFEHVFTFIFHRAWKQRV